MVAMFDVDDFLARCRVAVRETEPRRAIREELARVVAASGDVAEALRPAEAGIDVLVQDDDLTVLHVVWAPGMRIFPHDHGMWAAIGIYAGIEDNAFYRRDADDRSTLTESGGKRLEVGDTVVLGDATIHGVTNPASHLTGAIHVYGGDLINQARSQWGPGPLVERPYDLDLAREQFAEANTAWRSEGD